MSQTIYWGQFRWQRHTPDVRGYAGAIHSARFAVARAGWHSSWFKVKAACSVCPTVYCESKMKFLWGIGKLKVSSGYSSSLQKHVVKGKIQNLKSHDMHILSQQIIPMAIWHVLHPGIQLGIIKLSDVFQENLRRGHCTCRITVAKRVCGRDVVHIRGMVAFFFLGYTFPPCHPSSWRTGNM